MKEAEVLQPASPRRLYFYSSILLFRASLDLMYVMFIQPMFAYAGFELGASTVTYVESWLLVAFACMFLSASLKRPSDFFLLTLMLGLVVPMTSLYGLADKPRFVVYVVISSFALISIIRLGKIVRLPTVRHGALFAVLIAAFSTCAVLIWLGVSGGFSFLNLSLSKVYELRGSVGEVISRGWFSYINLWVFKVFNIFLFAYALHRRAIITASVVLFLQVLFFAISAHKGVLFYPLMVLAIWYYLRKSNRLAIVPFGLFLVVTFSGLLWWLGDLAIVGSLFVRRIFFVTASNAYDYFEFFSSNPRVFWANSVMSSFIDYPYHLNPPELIAEWRGRLGHVNNTFIANGYMHAGLPGLFLYCVLVGYLFRLIDSLSAHGVPTWLGLSVTIVPVWSLMLSADLPTALMTHGLGVAVLLLFLLRGRATESRGRERAPVARLPMVPAR